MKQIKFIAIGEKSAFFNNFPELAKKNIPYWYRKTPKFLNQDKKLQLTESNNPNVTMKSCIPFLDALTTGYVWKLPADIEISKKDDAFIVRWRLNDNWIDIHSPEQVPKLPIPIEINQQSAVFKFIANFRIKMPKGYSTLYVPPLNQYNLPIRVFSGVVDNDTYPLEVNFPFQIVKNLENEECMIIEKGTPIVQIIPIKREKWISKNIRDLDYKAYFETVNKYLSKIKNAYKEQSWVRKHYE